AGSRRIRVGKDKRTQEEAREVTRLRSEGQANAGLPSEGRRYIGEETAGPSYRLVRDADEFGMTGAGGGGKSKEPAGHVRQAQCRVWRYKMQRTQQIARGWLVLRSAAFA